MIVTVTLNAALDITYRVPRLRPAAEHRVAETAERPGGKGAAEAPRPPRAVRCGGGWVRRCAANSSPPVTV
ncbi:hypothetical protein AB0C60_13180, partial [Streptomyces sp. NPDC048845]